ncbi:MAG: hypothetical protein ACYTEP_05215 [Planctomycetota bacterium]|jgi:predicted lipid-binding transport protein (Tim44 family)
MPQTRLHAAFPGAQPGTGFIATLMRVLIGGVFLFFAFFLLLFTLVLGLFLMLLRALGIGPKRTAPTMPFGFPFQGQAAPSDQAGHADTPPSSAEGTQEKTPERLEAFHGSLEEFMQQKKDDQGS